MTREEYAEKIDVKLRALFSDGAEEKRAEVLACAAKETLGPPDLGATTALKRMGYVNA